MSPDLYLTFVLATVVLTLIPGLNIILIGAETCVLDSHARSSRPVTGPHISSSWPPS